MYEYKAEKTCISEWNAQMIIYKKGNSQLKKNTFQNQFSIDLGSQN